MAFDPCLKRNETTDTNPYGCSRTVNLQITAVKLRPCANAEVKYMCLMLGIVWRHLPRLMPGCCGRTVWTHRARCVPWRCDRCSSRQLPKIPGTALKTTKSDIWMLSSHELRTSWIAVRHLFNPVARGAPMATCIRRLHCWKLSQSKCWVQTSKYVSIFLGGPRLLFIFHLFIFTWHCWNRWNWPAVIAHLAPWQKSAGAPDVSESPSVDLARLGFGENFQVSPCFTMFHHVSPHDLLILLASLASLRWYQVLLGGLWCQVPQAGRLLPEILRSTDDWFRLSRLLRLLRSSADFLLEWERLSTWFPQTFVPQYHPRCLKLC